MDKDKYKLGKTRDEKPEGFYDTDQIFEFFKRLKYENKNKIRDLLNPINFIIWLVVSFKDIF